MNRISPAIAVSLGTVLVAVVMTGCGAVHHPLDEGTDSGAVAGSGGSSGSGGLGGTGGTVTPDPPGAGGNNGGNGSVDAGRRGGGDGGRRGGGSDAGATTDPRPDGGRTGGDRDGGRTGGSDGGRQRPDAAPIPACPAGSTQGGMCTAMGMATICTMTGDGGVAALCSCRARDGMPGTWRCFRR